MLRDSSMEIVFSSSVYNLNWVFTIENITICGMRSCLGLIAEMNEHKNVKTFLRIFYNQNLTHFNNDQSHDSVQ